MDVYKCTDPGSYCRSPFNPVYYGAQPNDLGFLLNFAGGYQTILLRGSQINQDNLKKLIQKIGEG